MTQRDFMRSLYRKYRGNETLIMNAYASGEREGVVQRRSNRYGLTAEEYAKALHRDGIQKGWIAEGVRN